ncbi:MAG: hypothetical protein H0T79_14375, partial [Deltaproteobacteria bacterium]|nr:hypothetical protein [Deltaproteobacteria bacterium]
MVVRSVALVVMVGCGFQGHGLADGSASVVDALPLDAAVGCPGGWFTIAGSSSQYTVANSPNRTWWDAEAACEAAALPGGTKTHLVALETLAEADA